MSEEKVKSEVLYKKIIETMDRKEEILLSTESATDAGAWDLFTKLKKEMKMNV
jgi:hypothetical protein